MRENGRIQLKQTRAREDEYRVVTLAILSWSSRLVSAMLETCVAWESNK